MDKITIGSLGLNAALVVAGITLFQMQEGVLVYDVEESIVTSSATMISISAALALAADVDADKLVACERIDGVADGAIVALARCTFAAGTNTETGDPLITMRVLPPSFVAGIDTLLTEASTLPWSKIEPMNVVVDGVMSKAAKIVFTGSSVATSMSDIPEGVPLRSAIRPVADSVPSDLDGSKVVGP